MSLERALGRLSRLRAIRYAHLRLRLRAAGLVLP